MTDVAQATAPLDDAREASSRAAWREAYEAYSTLPQSELDAADLERYGESAWWRGKLEEAIALRERAYAAYTAAGDIQGAARMALTLSWDYEGRGSFAVAGGWEANAERLLEGQPEWPEHARLLGGHRHDDRRKPDLDFAHETTGVATSGSASEQRTREGAGPKSVGTSVARIPHPVSSAASTGSANRRRTFTRRHPCPSRPAPPARSRPAAVAA